MNQVSVVLKEHWRIVVWVVGLAIVLLGYVFLQDPAEPHLSAETVFVSETIESDVIAAEERVIVVDIKGEVKIPGIYHLAEGARLYELIQEAGGVTEAALASAVNLAQMLQDQQMIVIPHKDDASLFTAENNLQSNQEADINLLININHADVSQLQTLPGIGAKKAEAIIQYREEHGFFKGIDDLMKVTGIGDKTFESLKEMIVVD